VETRWDGLAPAATKDGGYWGQAGRKEGSLKVSGERSQKEV
jgi:hypothetical protein